MDDLTLGLDFSVEGPEELVENLVRALMHELPAAFGTRQMALYELQVRLLSPVGEGRREYHGQLECVHRGDRIMFGQASLEDSSGSPIAQATATFRLLGDAFHAPEDMVR